MRQVNSQSGHERQGRDVAARRAKVIWAAELCERWDVSLVTLWRWRRRGQMPAPDFQGTGWLVATIEAFENGEKASEQSDAAARRAH
jgi:predicted site-specific integrase-resolvase